jgi:hypothetical protein
MVICAWSQWDTLITLIRPRALPIGDMTAAIEYVDRMVPRGAPLFVDSETREVLRYYLALNDTSLDTLRSEAGVEKRLGGYRVVLAIRKHAFWLAVPASIHPNTLSQA